MSVVEHWQRHPAYMQEALQFDPGLVVMTDAVTRHGSYAFITGTGDCELARVGVKAADGCGGSDERTLVALTLRKL